MGTFPVLGRTALHPCGGTLGDRPTIIDVARKAGVSKSTVSRVLQGEGASVSEEARQAVWCAVAELGYERNAVATSLRTDRTNMVMLAIPDITNPFWPEVARGLQDTVEEAGYSVVFANSDWDARRELLFLSLARRNRFDAIAINPTAVTNEELALGGIPTVILGLRDGYPDFDMAGSDSLGGTLEALDYLYRLGHRRIGLILGRHYSDRRQARSDGYLEFLRRQRLPVDRALIVEAAFDRPSGERAMQALLALPEPPSAVLAANDILAIGAMQAAHRAGLRIPADLSIMGMDDIYSASTTTPPLTTMAKDKYGTGRQAAYLLLERIEGRASAQACRKVIPCRLIERGSTAPPRQL